MSLLSQQTVTDACDTTNISWWRLGVPYEQHATCHFTHFKLSRCHLTPAGNMDLVRENLDTATEAGPRSFHLAQWCMKPKNDRPSGSKITLIFHMVGAIEQTH